MDFKIFRRLVILFIINIRKKFKMKKVTFKKKRTYKLFDKANRVMFKLSIIRTNFVIPNDYIRMSYNTYMSSIKSVTPFLSVYPYYYEINGQNLWATDATGVPLHWGNDNLFWFPKDNTYYFDKQLTGSQFTFNNKLDTSKGFYIIYSGESILANAVGNSIYACKNYIATQHYVGVGLSIGGKYNGLSKDILQKIENDLKAECNTNTLYLSNYNMFYFDLENAYNVTADDFIALFKLIKRNNNLKKYFGHPMLIMVGVPHSGTTLARDLLAAENGYFDFFQNRMYSSDFGVINEYGESVTDSMSWSEYPDAVKTSRQYDNFKENMFIPGLFSDDLYNNGSSSTPNLKSLQLTDSLTSNIVLTPTSNSINYTIDTGCKDFFKLVFPGSTSLGGYTTWINGTLTPVTPVTPSDSFYLKPSLDNYYITPSDEGGQSHRIINSQINKYKTLIVPYGGNNTDKQQGTSEAHCYFVTYIINQYIVQRKNKEDTALMIKRLVQSLNFITEIVAINAVNGNSNNKDVISGMYFPPWEFYVNEEDHLSLCSTPESSVPWSAQDSNQQLLCMLLRLYFFNLQDDNYLDRCPSSDIITTAEARTYSTTNKSSFYDYSQAPFNLVDSESILYNLKQLIHQYISKINIDPDDMIGGNFAKDETYDIFFASGTTNKTNEGTASIGSTIQHNEDGSIKHQYDIEGVVKDADGYITNASIIASGYNWPDYVSYYLYVLMRYYIENENLDIDTTKYKDAMHNYIDWILVTTSRNNKGGESIKNARFGINGDGASASFNRLVYQVAELLIVYNKGDTAIGLSKSTVQDYFDETYYTKLKSVATNLFNIEQSNDSLYLSPSDNGGLNFYYIDSAYQNRYVKNVNDIDDLTHYVSGEAVLSGYIRMISYLIMIENNYITPTKRSLNFAGEWPGIDKTFTTNYTFTKWYPDSSQQPIISNRGSGILPNSVIAIISTNDANAIDYAYDGGIVGYFTIDVDSDGSYKGYKNLTLNTPSSQGLSATKFVLVQCKEGVQIPTKQDDIIANKTYLENITLNDLMGENGIDNNLYQQITKWEDKSTLSSFINYFNPPASETGSPHQYTLNSGVSWANGSGPYFAWSMMTLHMSNYRLNNL